MALVTYKSNNQMMKKKKNKNNQVGFSLNPNQLAYDLGFGAMNGAGKLAVKAVRGIVSAFQSRGASKNEISALVAPLAKSLTYTSRKPKFTKAEGGLAIEHIENVPIGTGRTDYVVDTNLFVWLRNIASQFEEYQIQTWFAWNPICPATTTGQVLMAYDYDPADDDAGQYLQAADYFNTADHCISAIWAPAAIAPQKSAWLKTGNTGDSRLYSPGRFHMSVTDASNGYLTVRYQVSFRKPQPRATESDASFTGSYSTSTGVFASRSGLAGNFSLFGTITDSTLTVAPSSGYKLVIWSTDGTSSSVVPVVTGGTIVGTLASDNSSFVVSVPPGTTGTITATVTAPGGPTDYKVVLYQEGVSPTYF